MGTLHRIWEWSTTHHPKWLVVLRVALGLCLFAKGISFMSDTTALEQLIAGSPMQKGLDWLPIAISWANLLGGFFLTVGLMTRWVALLELPILAGAIIFINVKKGFFAAGPEIGLALAVFLLLVLFLIVGGGPLSLDDYFSKNRDPQSRGTNL